MAAELTVANINASSGVAPMRSWLWLLVPLLAGLLVGFGACGGADPNLRLKFFFAPLLIATFALPHFLLTETKLSRQIGACMLISLGMTLPWLIFTPLSFYDSTRCGMVAAAYFITIGGFAAMLARCGIGTTFAAAFSSLLGFAWLSWPIWLCPWLGGPRAQAIVDALVFAHPLMALNRVGIDLYGEWDRGPLLYNITIFNQDVIYKIPSGIAWSCIVHLAIGAACFFAAGWGRDAHRNTPEQAHVG